jgi:hypothetical protein
MFSVSGEGGKNSILDDLLVEKCFRELKLVGWKMEEPSRNPAEAVGVAKLRVATLLMLAESAVASIVFEGFMMPSNIFVVQDYDGGGDSQ